MEVISHSELQSYEIILEEINREHEKSEEIKKNINSVDDQILTLKLSKLEQSPKISHVIVKIFNTAAEIQNLYSSEVAHCNFDSLYKLRNCKFYLVQIYLVKLIVQKLSGFKLLISVNSPNFTFHHITLLSNNIDQILEVIPVSFDIVDCTVESILFSSHNWDIIDLYAVKIDVSYHFQMCKHKKVRLKTKQDKQLYVSKLYPNSHVDIKAADSLKPNLQAQVLLHPEMDKTNFLSLVFRNSFHNLDMELLSVGCFESTCIELQFLIGGEKVSLTFDSSTNVLRIQCDLSFMQCLKKYFWMHSICDINRTRSNLKKLVARSKTLEYATVREIILFYEEVRKNLL